MSGCVGHPTSFKNLTNKTTTATFHLTVYYENKTAIQIFIRGIENCNPLFTDLRQTELVEIKNKNERH